MLIVVPGFRFANATAPRRLQSFGAAVQAEAENASSVRSTVTEANATKFAEATFALAAVGPRILMRLLIRSPLPIRKPLEYATAERGIVAKASAATTNKAIPIKSPVCDRR